MSENFKELFQNSLKSTEMRIGKIIKANIVAIERDCAWIDAGLKSESIVPLNQFLDKEGKVEISIGDEVDVVLDALDNNFGETRLSREKAKRIEVWDKLQTACTRQEIVSGRITHHVRGGYTVEVEGLRGFLPGSLVDVRPIRDASHLEDKDIDFKIVKLDSKRNNIVVSRRAVIEAETQEDRASLFEKLTENSVVQGIVKNITDFGAFIDLGGIDGLLHITDMSWSRIKHPSQILSIGDEIDVKVIKFDSEKNRISLGMKQLGKDPWVNISKELSIGTKLIGKVTNITDYGCFVKLKEGIEGLVHTSEMDWKNKNANPHKTVSLSQEIEVMVLEIDAARHRISLGIKQCQVNPWKAFADSHKPGEEVIGKIRSITDFGVFIGLKGNIDGLVHISDVSWTNPEIFVKKLNKGEEVKAVMLSVDIERERIALGMKQLLEDPFSKFVASNKRGKKINGSVSSIQKNGAFVKVAPDVEGFVYFFNTSHNKAEEILKVDQNIDVFISGVDSRRRIISLSLKTLNEEVMTEKSNKSKLGYKPDQITPTTIGDLIKEKLNK